MPTLAQTSLSRSARPMTSLHSRSRVEMLSIVPMPAAARAADHLGLMLDEALIIEMAVAIDQHQASSLSSAGISSLGKSGVGGASVKAAACRSAYQFAASPS